MTELKIKITTKGMEELSKSLKILIKDIDKATASLERFNVIADGKDVKVNLSVDKVGDVSH